MKVRVRLRVVGEHDLQVDDLKEVRVRAGRRVTPSPRLVRVRVRVRA